MTRRDRGALFRVYALGEGAELFAGLYDNTQIHDKLLEAMGL